MARRALKKPGLVDASGGLRDLSAVVTDIAPVVLGADSMARLAALHHLPTTVLAWLLAAACLRQFLQSKLIYLKETPSTQTGV